MLSSVMGHYNGSNIVLDETVHMNPGQTVIITVLNEDEPKKRNIDLSRYVGRGPKMLQGDATEYVRELRTNDRA
ncbi:MAG: hypothetical protein VZR04_04955 [Succiniclasticum sp.]|nr:hypothetical protein [Succiniclasticum sp.]